MQCVAALGKNNLVVRFIQSRPAYHIILSQRDVGHCSDCQTGVQVYYGSRLSCRQ